MLAQTSLIRVARSQRRWLSGGLGATTLRCVLPAETGSTSLLLGCFKITAGRCAAFFAESWSPAAPGCRLQHRHHCGATTLKHRHRGAVFLCCVPEGLLMNYTFPMLHQAALWLFFPCFILFFQLVQLSVMHLQDMALLCDYNFFFHYKPTLAGSFQSS